MVRDEYIRGVRSDAGQKGAEFGHLGGRPTTANKTANKTAKQTASDGQSEGQNIPPSVSSSSSSSKNNTSEEFETAWSLYPKRAGGNSKATAFKAWLARIADGCLPADLIAGVNRYAAFIQATDKSCSEFVQQASTFFGPGKHFAEPWTAPTKIAKTPFEGHHSLPNLKEFPR